MTYTLAELEDLCREWQKVLRLQDWAFYIFIKRGYDMGTFVGSFSPTITKKEAKISLLDPNDYPPDTVYPYDQEETLVHEMIHAHFASFWDDDKCNDMEWAIESLTKAVVSLKRNVNSFSVNEEG